MNRLAILLQRCKFASRWVTVSIGFGIAMAGCCKTNGDYASPLFNSTDQHFMVNESYNNYDEKDAGGFASDRPSDTVVAQFGQMIAAGYAGAQADLITAAVSFSLFLPKGPDSAYLLRKLALQSLPSAVFDTAFLQMEATSEGQEIAALQVELAEGQDTLLKDYANKYIAKRQTYLRLADSVLTMLHFN